MTVGWGFERAVKISTYSLGCIRRIVANNNRFLKLQSFNEKGEGSK